MLHIIEIFLWAMAFLTLYIFMAILIMYLVVKLIRYYTQCTNPLYIVHDSHLVPIYNRGDLLVLFNNTATGEPLTVTLNDFIGFKVNGNFVVEQIIEMNLQNDNWMLDVITEVPASLNGAMVRQRFSLLREDVIGRVEKVYSGWGTRGIYVCFLSYTIAFLVITTSLLYLFDKI